MKKFVIVLPAVAGMTVAAHAQNFSVQYRWVARATTVGGGMLGDQIADGTVVSGGILNVTSAYRQRFELQAFVTRNGPGENGGLAAAEGRIDVTGAGSDDLLHNYRGAGAITAGLGRQSPFNFGSDAAVAVNNGVQLPASSTIRRVDGIHNVTTGMPFFFESVWHTGQPFPSDPDHGANTWAPIFRVLVDINASQLDGTLATVTYAPFRAFVIDEWVTEPRVVPVPEEEPSNFLFIPHTVVAATQFSTSFQIQLAPAPTSGVLLGLGGVISVRRRRR